MNARTAAIGGAQNFRSRISPALQTAFICIRSLKFTACGILPLGPDYAELTREARGEIKSFAADLDWHQAPDDPAQEQAVGKVP